MTAPAQHATHANHTHQHGTNCGHMAVKHDEHTDYLHDGHMHYPHAGHVDEHVFAVDPAHPSGCSPQRDCDPHNGHCDDHGAIEIAIQAVREDA
jgi:hypothetical protein